MSTFTLISRGPGGRITLVTQPGVGRGAAADADTTPAPTLLASADNFLITAQPKGVGGTTNEETARSLDNLIGRLDNWLVGMGVVRDTEPTGEPRTTAEQLAAERARRRRADQLRDANRAQQDRQAGNGLVMSQSGVPGAQDP